jgi:hypothetical protein
VVRKRIGSSSIGSVSSAVPAGTVKPSGRSVWSRASRICTTPIDGIGAW